MNKDALIKAAAATAVYATFCILITTYPRFELFRVIILIMEFPAFFLNTLLGGNIHDFDPTPAYVLYGVGLFAIVYSANKVRPAPKASSGAT